MKIATSLCLGLALFSPVSALRGTQKPPEKEPRELQDYADLGEPPEKVQMPTLPPTPPPVEGVPESAVMMEAEPWVVDEMALFSQAAKKGKSKNSKDKDSKDGDAEADLLCEDFCRRYMATCEGANVFFNPDTPRGVPARRRLIAGTQMETARLSGSVFETLDDCLDACAYYPRPTNPSTDYLDPEVLGVNSIGDTFWCRDTHLKIAERTKTTHFGAQTHCPFAAPSGGGLCTNVIVDSSELPGYNASVYEFVRAGTETSRMVGYCQMYFNDIVADCTSAGIDNDNLELALALMPLETEIIILNNNVGKRDPVTGNTLGDGITALANRPFRGLLNPENIKAVIIDDGNINTIEGDTFNALVNLESLSLNMQLIEELPMGMLANTPNLREFSIYNTRDKPGQLTSLPANLFTERAERIQRIVISGHRGLTTLPAAIFAELYSLSVLILSNNGLTNRGVNPLTFQTLIALQIWDMSNNQFTTAEAMWLNTGWAWSLTHLYLQQNPMTKLEEGIFDVFDFGCKLEVVLLHDTDIRSPPMNTFDFCAATLISYTISPRV